MHVKSAARVVQYLLGAVHIRSDEGRGLGNVGLRDSCGFLEVGLGGVQSLFRVPDEEKRREATGRGGK
jgi:hypothetical protein